jgi:hypothetical protein
MVADGTGGKIFQGDYGMVENVQKAVEDSSDFYEIAYYPDLQNWTGEYRKIILKTRTPGLHLAYRQGYFAKPEGSETPSDWKAALQRAACVEPLDATAIFFSARSVPADAPDALRFRLKIDSSMVTLAPGNGGERELHLRIAACTFDKTGNPLQFMTDTVDRKFNPDETQSLAAQGLPHDVQVSGPRPAAVRIAVMDMPTGNIGTLRTPVN